MTPEQIVERCTSRIAAVTSGKAKMERLIAADPTSPKAKVWRQRVAEYKESMAGLPIQLRQAQDKIAKRQAAELAAKKK